MANTIPKGYVNLLAQLIRQYEKDTGVDVAGLAAVHRAEGFTPYRFRVGLWHRAVPTRWLNELKADIPGLTDAALDTAMRSALRGASINNDWAQSQPLRR